MPFRGPEIYAWGVQVVKLLDLTAGTYVPGTSIVRNIRYSNPVVNKSSKFYIL